MCQQATIFVGAARLDSAPPRGVGDQPACNAVRANYKDHQGGSLMGLLRSRDELEGTAYRMREKIFSIGEDYWIETDGGENAFKVNGKALRLRQTFVLEAPSGEELFKIQEKKLRVRDTMKIERNGDTVATVRKALVSPIRDRFSVEVEDGDEIEVKGNIVDHEYEFEQGGRKVAQVSKRWFRVRDTYGIQVVAGQDDALLLAVSVCVEQMAHER
jgi:uncharacterized protein YxjI